MMPIPSEIVMPFSGYLASQGRFALIWAALAGALGCNIGSTVIYYVGAIGGRAMVEKYGRYVFLTEAKINRVEHYFGRWGGITIFVARLMPFLPVVVSLPAGFARMPMWKFQIYTFAGCFIWCFVLAWLGFEFGRAWQSTPWVKNAMHGFNLAVVVVLGLLIAWFAWRWWRSLSKPH